MKRPKINPGSAGLWRDYSWNYNGNDPYQIVTNDAGRGMLQYIKELEAYADQLEALVRSLGQAPSPTEPNPFDPAAWGGLTPEGKDKSYGQQLMELQKKVAYQQKQLDGRPTVQAIDLMMKRAAKQAVADAFADIKLVVLK